MKAASVVADVIGRWTKCGFPGLRERPASSLAAILTRMNGESITGDPALPVEGTTDVSLSVEDMWDAFANVPGWPDWNPCMAWARVTGGELKEGATLYWAFKPIRRRYLYRMPAVAKIIECEPRRKVTWEVSAPGFHARHSYLFEPGGPDSSRFGSWEVAEGRSYSLMRRFWLAHFRFVRDQSLAGARALGASDTAADG